MMRVSKEEFLGLDIPEGSFDRVNQMILNLKNGYEVIVDLLTNTTRAINSLIKSYARYFKESKIVMERSQYNNKHQRPKKCKHGMPYRQSYKKYHRQHKE